MKDGSPVDEGVVGEREPWGREKGLEGLGLHRGKDGAWGTGPCLRGWNTRRGLHHLWGAAHRLHVC